MSGGRAPGFALAVYGGTFNPPHPGHESVIYRTLLCAEQVALVPSHRHTLGRRMGDFELCCCQLTRLARQIGSRRVYCEPTEAGLMPDHPTVYSIDLLGALAAHSGPASARIALLIGVDNEVELPHFECTAKLCWRFGRLVVKERLPLHSSMTHRRLREGLAVPEAWCLPEVKSELYYYDGEHQAV